MDTRVTLQTVFQNALVDSRRLTDQLAQLQSQAATGKRYQNVSDDPAASLAILANSAQEQTIGTHLDNVGVVRSALNTSVSTLQQVATIFSQARSIAIDAGNSTNNTSSFEAMAREVDTMIDQVLSLANTKQGNTYLYGGSADRKVPFAVTSADAQGRPLSIAYQGSQQSGSAFISQTQQVSVFYPGSDVFQQLKRGAATYQGTTGAAAGLGTDTASTGQTLVVTHTATTFAPGSGVQAGASSAAGDTILGPAGTHQLQIVDTSGNGTAGTISLDGGPPVAFTNADTNLRVNSPTGNIVYLDTTAIAPGFSGSIDLTGDGTLSIDGGATTTPITFTNNQVVTDGSSGAVTFVDTTKITQAGTELVDHPGTYDTFQALIALRDDLRNVNHLSLKEQIDAISAHIGELDRVQTSILDKVGQQSATLATLDSVESHLQDLQLTVKQTVSNLQDIDITDIVVKLQSYNQMLQLSLGTYSKVISQSLLDFLR